MMWLVPFVGGVVGVVASTYVWRWVCKRKQWVGHREWPTWAYPLFYALVAYDLGERAWGPVNGLIALPFAAVCLFATALMVATVGEFRAYVRVQRRERGK